MGMSFVAKRFRLFLGNLRLTDPQRKDGNTKHTGVRSALNAHYYGLSSGDVNSMLVGSWGKSTETRPPRDIDVLFILPYSVYQRYEQRPYWANKQSELLQEVRGVLGQTYTMTRIRGDGQVVVVPFATYPVEVVPAFAHGTQFRICDTNAGGRYKTIDPIAEISHISYADSTTKGNARDLCRMLKSWQAFCSVPLRSFELELLAVTFLRQWQYTGNSEVYYDWMIRDFLEYALTQVNGWVIVPGTYEAVALGNDWESRTVSAHSRAAKACDYEGADKDFDAGYEWQKLFGSDIPLTVA